MTKPTGDTMSPQLKQILRTEWNMKWKAMVALLANRINQPHVIDCYMRKVHRGGFDRGVEHVMSLPLAQRLTAEEKERVKGIYNEELGMAQHFHKKAKASNDISCRQHYYGLREPYISRMKLLERIFGADFFKEGGMIWQ